MSRYKNFVLFYSELFYFQDKYNEQSEQMKRLNKLLSLVTTVSMSPVQKKLEDGAYSYAYHLEKQQDSIA